MDKQLQTDSPFGSAAPVRLGWGTMMLMLLTVVGAGVGLLVYYALRVPALTSEVNAWLGRPDLVVDQAEGRRAQLVFALFVYTSPLALGIFVYVLHFLLNWFDRQSRLRRQASSEEPFRME